MGALPRWRRGASHEKFFESGEAVEVGKGPSGECSSKGNGRVTILFRPSTTREVYPKRVKDAAILYVRLSSMTERGVTETIVFMSVLASLNDEAMSQSQ